MYTIHLPKEIDRKCPQNYMKRGHSFTWTPTPKKYTDAHTDMNCLLISPIFSVKHQHTQHSTVYNYTAQFVWALVRTRALMYTSVHYTMQIVTRQFAETISSLGTSEESEHEISSLC